MLVVNFNLVQRFLEVREREAESRQDLEPNPLLTQGVNHDTTQTLFGSLKTCLGQSL